MQSLSLIRHAQPANANIILGQLDPPLARITRNKQGSVQFDEDTLVISSPLRRARQTAAIFGYEDPIIDTRVAEMDLGRFQGLEKSASVLKEISSLDRDPTSNDHGGESFSQFLERVEDFYTEYRETSKPVVVFTHEGVIRALSCKILDLSSREYSPKYLEMITIDNDCDKTQLSKQQFLLSMS